MRNRTRKNITKKNKKSGGATSLPLSYFNSTIDKISAYAGKDVLLSTPTTIRPRIEGGRKRVLRKLNKTKKAKKESKMKGGFVPTIMEGFSQAAAKYITPLVLFSGYKLLNKYKKTQKRQKKRSTHKTK
jgi:hypothetical protein